jgi:hypothetical protein
MAHFCRFYQMDKLSLQDHVGKIRVALCDKGNALKHFVVILLNSNPLGVATLLFIFNVLHMSPRLPLLSLS